MMTIRYKSYLLYLLLLGFSLWGLPVSGQSINPNDLSSLRIDQLSDEQIRSFVSQAAASGLSETEMEQMALQRGLPSAEIQKLRQRIEQLGISPETKSDPRHHRNTTSTQRTVSDSIPVPERISDPQKTAKADTAVIAIRDRLFGAALFKDSRPAFEPDLRLATPSNYVIGPEDELVLEIFGHSEADYSLVVTPDGNINIPYAGVIQVAGMTIEQATARIKSRLIPIYAGISTGATRINISLGNIRSIKVTITGEVVKPGTYTLPSLATAFNALYASGGPAENGSFRAIQVIRKGQTVATLDIYEFLLNGTFNENIGLQDQDVLFVPTYQNRAEMAGEVKRPLIFELKTGETFEYLLRYAGGFTEEAYRARIKVVRNTATEHRMEDLLSSQFSQYQPQSGDTYTVDRILKRYANRVTISGAVYRPGGYELSPGLTLSMLIKKADGVTEDAFLNRGLILRLKPDLQTEQVSFDVAAILAGTAPDISLKREDRITISSIFDLREQYTVRIEGEVRQPGVFPFAAGMTVEELILQAGGFRESATARRIEISRRVQHTTDSLSASADIAEVFQVSANRQLEEQEARFVLQPFDMVVIRTAPGYESQKTVRIEGEVLFPGSYAIMRKDERISDLIKRAGGFTPYAYAEGASLRRGADEQMTTGSAREQNEKILELEKEREREQSLRMLQQNIKSVDEELLARSLHNNRVGINLGAIMERPGDEEDLILESGDLIRIPKELQTVKISGEVLSPVTVVYAPSKGFRQYISQSGGFTQRALKKRAYVIYANGVAKSTSRFLFFNNYPSVRPGAELFVPQKQVRERLNASQWIGIGTGLASMAAIIVSLLR